MHAKRINSGLRMHMPNFVGDREVTVIWPRGRRCAVHRNSYIRIKNLTFVR
jgi:hypothetical protein